MAVVSRTSIKSLIEKGDIVVHPLNENKIGNCSIDVRLGEWFFRRNPSSHVVYPYCDGSIMIEKQSTVHPWNTTPQKALKAKELGMVVSGIDPETSLIVLSPGEMILATTEEFIGSRLECTTMAKTKSTLARLGIDVVSSAGWGDIGYINRWGFPIHNKSQNTIILRPGTWIAQIVFLKVSDKELSYTSGGNYQATDEFEKLIKEWDPKSILPKVLSVTPIENK